MSSIYIKYFDFNPLQQTHLVGGRNIPREILALITEFVAVDSSLKNILSWGSVCQITLAECIRSCVRLRNVLFFSQLYSFNFSVAKEEKSSFLHLCSICRRAERDGSTLFSPFHVYGNTFNFFNLSKAVPYDHYRETQSYGNDSVFPPNDCLVIKDNVIIFANETLFIYKFDENYQLSYLKNIPFKGAVGVWSGKLVLISQKEGKIFLVEKVADLESCALTLFETNTSTTPCTLLTTSDHLFRVVDKIKLEEITFAPDHTIKTLREITLPEDLRSWCYTVSENWLAYPTKRGSKRDDDPHYLVVINLASGQVVISADDNYCLPYLLNDKIMIREDFLILKYHEKEPIWIYLPSKRDMSAYINPFFAPFLKEKQRWLIDFALIFDYETGKKTLRLFLGSIGISRYNTQQSWVIDLDWDYMTDAVQKIAYWHEVTEAEPSEAPKSAIYHAFPSQKRCLTQQKTYWVAAGVFILLGVGSGILFEVYFIAPYLNVGMNILVSLPAVITVAGGLGASIISMILASLVKN